MNVEDMGKGLAGALPHLEKAGILSDPPHRIAGRLLGLGNPEMDAGIPKWAWALVGLIAGGAVVYVYGDDLRRWVGQRRSE